MAMNQFEMDKTMEIRQYLKILWLKLAKFVDSWSCLT